MDRKKTDERSGGSRQPSGSQQQGRVGGQQAQQSSGTRPPQQQHPRDRRQEHLVRGPSRFQLQQQLRGQQNQWIPQLQLNQQRQQLFWPPQQWGDPQFRFYRQPQQQLGGRQYQQDPQLRQQSHRDQQSQQQPQIQIRGPSVQGRLRKITKQSQEQQISQEQVQTPADLERPGTSRDTTIPHQPYHDQQFQQKSHRVQQPQTHHHWSLSVQEWVKEKRKHSQEQQISQEQVKTPADLEQPGTSRDQQVRRTDIQDQPTQPPHQADPTEWAEIYIQLETSARLSRTPEQIEEDRHTQQLEQQQQLYQPEYVPEVQKRLEKYKSQAQEQKPAQVQEQVKSPGDQQPPDTQYVPWDQKQLKRPTDLQLPGISQDQRKHRGFQAPQIPRIPYQRPMKHPSPSPGLQRPEFPPRLRARARGRSRVATRDQSQIPMVGRSPDKSPRFEQKDFQEQSQQDAKPPPRDQGLGQQAVVTEEAVLKKEEIEQSPPTRPAQYVGQLQAQPAQQTAPIEVFPSTSRAAPTDDKVSREMELLTRQFDLLEIIHYDESYLLDDVQEPGTRGKSISVHVNYLPIKFNNTISMVLLYDVNITPNFPKSLLRKALNSFREKHYSDQHPAYDGRNNLYSVRQLAPRGSLSAEVEVHDEYGMKQKFKIEIKHVKNIDLTPLVNLELRQIPHEVLQVSDVILRSALANNMSISTARNFFDDTVAVDLGQGMEMYSGLHQSVVKGRALYLNVDLVHKAFPRPECLLDVVKSVLQLTNLGTLADHQTRRLTYFVKNLKVVYSIPSIPSSTRMYQVIELSEPAAVMRFQMEGRDITVEEYYRVHKKYPLQYPNLPTVCVKKQGTRRVCLPLELCSVAKHQVVFKKLTDNQTRLMITNTATSTDNRKTKIMKALRQANHNCDATVKEFHFSLVDEFEEVPARVLQPPTLAYGPSIDRPDEVIPSKGVWKARNFVLGGTINKWTIAVCPTGRESPTPRKLHDLALSIQRLASESGMTIASAAETPFFQIPDSKNHREIINNIRKYFQDVKDKEYDIIFIIIPNYGKQYTYIKKEAELNAGCLTQCIKIDTVNNKLKEFTVRNILLKVNSKLNGVNQRLSTPPQFFTTPCMVMGADVTHPSPDARNSPSVAAVTASHDQTTFQYNVCWRLQPPRAEIITDLKDIVIEQLLYFQEKTQCLPEKIIFFRDGVSEGEFKKVRKIEIQAIKAGCIQILKGFKPSITFLVVQKRHHMRMFPSEPADAEDKNNNVPVGTCVDSVITHPYMQNFYLVSHASLRGVVKPTKYCTLWDENSMSIDDIEEITYCLCHMFTRCNRSVSYPAPTYYAHLAAARAKHYIDNEDLNMENLAGETRRFQIQHVIQKEKPMFFV